MSNKAITTNDLKAVLDVVLPPQPSEYRKLLWTNPNPTSSFAAQTISLDLSDYDAIEIIIRADTANTYTLAPIVTEVGKGGTAYVSTAYNSNRSFTSSTSGVTFTAASYHSAYGNWSTTSTNALIPVYIYGIKYERVAPPQVEYPNYSTEEQQVGTFIDGKPIYRKCQTYVWGGNRIYDDDFFNGVPFENIVSIRPQVLSNATYIQTTFFWTSTDYCRCWVYGSGANKGRVAIDGSMSVGANMLFVAEYTKTTD